MLKKVANEIWRIRKLPSAVAVSIGMMDPEEVREQAHPDLKALAMFAGAGVVGICMVGYWSFQALVQTAERLGRRL